MEGKDKNVKSGSKPNLNESTVPLLDDVDALDKGDSEKEKIEIKEKASSSGDSDGEKDDSKTENDVKDSEAGDGGSKNDTEPVTEEPKKKNKKEAHKKQHRRGPSRVQNMTVGLNLLDRDEKRVSDVVNLNFEDIIAEPDSSHSLDLPWRITYLVFSATKLWTYRILAALCAIPCAIGWGINFALLAFLHIWCVNPLLKTLDLVLYLFRKVWHVFVRSILDPFFTAIGTMFRDVHVTWHAPQPHQSLHEPCV